MTRAYEPSPLGIFAPVLGGAFFGGLAIVVIEVFGVTAGTVYVVALALLAVALVAYALSV